MWSLVIAAVTLISTFTVYGYRLDAVEKQVAANSTAITQLDQNNNQTAVTLAKIQTDIEYIKVAIDRLSNRTTTVKNDPLLSI